MQSHSIPRRQMNIISRREIRRTRQRPAITRLSLSEKKATSATRIYDLCPGIRILRQRRERDVRPACGSRWHHKVGPRRGAALPFSKGKKTQSGGEETSRRLERRIGSPREGLEGDHGEPVLPLDPSGDLGEEPPA